MTLFAYIANLFMSHAPLDQIGTLSQMAIAGGLFLVLMSLDAAKRR